jgi:phage shock protein PspC (stress-responsive transcriptional regulator)
MTTTDTADTADMTPPPPPQVRRLRRSRTDRIGAGVAGGLGEYFGVDPVLFRVLFATAAFFGGAGVLAYLLAWAAIPEAGTEHAAVDGWVTALRNRRVPFWLIVAAGALVIWLAAFSWWAPGPFFPVLAVVIILVVVFGRQGRADNRPAAPVSLTKPVQATAAAPDTAPPSDTTTPQWVGETRSWIAESRAAHRERARRASPVKVAVLLTLVATLLTIGLIDAVQGIALPVYFWFALAILGAGLLAGLVLRRTPWSLAVLLVPTVIGLIAFGGTRASLHDGIGQRDWVPTTAPSEHYKLAFGQATLDLRSLHVQGVPREVRIDQAAGELRIIAPKDLKLTVNTNVRFGVVTVDGETSHQGMSGAGVNRTVVPLSGAIGKPITIDVHLADGRVDIDRVTP